MRYCVMAALGVYSIAAGGLASAQTTLLEITFDDVAPELIGPISPNDNPPSLYQFHGDADLSFAHEIVSDGSGGYAYQQSADGANADPDPGVGGAGYYYVGGGGGFFIPAGFGLGEGADDPSNYYFTWDLSVAGQLGSVPLYFNFGQFDDDYEATSGNDVTGATDANNQPIPDGDTDDGADTFVVSDVPVELSMTPGNQTWSISLADAIAAGNGPSATPGIPAQDIQFSSENSIYFSWYFGHTEFGYDNGNSITFDNISIVFDPTAQPITPGDYNDDGNVDALDYAVWRENVGGDNLALKGNGDETDDSAGVVDQADFLLWLNNYGVGGAPAPAIPTPEPSCLAMLVLFALLTGRAAPRRVTGPVLS